MTRRRSKSGDAARRLELLWGPSERAVRGPKPGLTIEQIVSTAIQIADREGLGALTMRRVADELGFTTMALYRYVPGKDELIDRMRDVALGPPPPPPNAAAGDWASQLTQWARAALERIGRHPWLLEVIAYGPQGPNWVAWFEWAVRALSATGLTASEMLAILAVIDSHVRGTAQVSLAVARAEQDAGTPGAWEAVLGQSLERVVGDGRFPALALVMAGGGFGKGTAPSDDHFEFGLQRLLDGIEAYIRERSAPRGSRKAAPRRRR
jgi:AcrR family transcriptional regulator